MELPTLNAGRERGWESERDGGTGVRVVRSDSSDQFYNLTQRRQVTRVLYLSVGEKSNGIYWVRRERVLMGWVSKGRRFWMMTVEHTNKKTMMARKTRTQETR